jgi:hypothetical protein
MAMTYSVPCDPPAAAACDGFNFFRDLKGAIVGRCVWCLVGFSISEENAADVRANMVTHLNVCTDGASAERRSGGCLI